MRAPGRRLRGAVLIAAHAVSCSPLQSLLDAGFEDQPHGSGTFVDEHGQEYLVPSQGV